MKEDHLYKPISVPFSCCKLLSNRPCISSDINDKTKHYKYQPDVDMTINVVGCGKAAADFVKTAVIWYFVRIGIVFTIIEVTYIANNCIMVVRGRTVFFLCVMCLLLNSFGSVRSLDVHNNTKEGFSGISVSVWSRSRLNLSKVKK